MFKTALHPEITISFYKCPKVTPWGFSQGVNNVRIHILDSVFCFNRCKLGCKLEVGKPANPIKSRVFIKRFHRRDGLTNICFVMHYPAYRPVFFIPNCIVLYNSARCFGIFAVQMLYWASFCCTKSIRLFLTLYQCC